MIHMYSIHHFTVVLFVYITSVSSELQCNLAKECIGSEFNDLSESIFVQGYMAAFGPTTNYVGSHHLSCNGAYACSSMEFIKQSMTSEWVLCLGSNSCSNTTIRSAYNQNTRAIICYGHNACMGSNIYYTNNTAMLECAGYRSCAHANIYGVSDNCEIISPNIPNSNVPLTNLTYFNTISYDLNIFTDFQDALNTDILCTKNGSYDSWYAADANITLEIDEKGPICCRGATSCSQNIIKYETQKKTDLICSGYDACRGSYISNINDTVFCEGRDSCYGSMIRYIDYLYCVGASSCRESDIIGARYIKCDGSWSCRESTFRSNGVDLFLYLNGYSSGRNTTIYCDKTDNCTINCIGFWSCEATQVFCDTDAVNCIINCDIDIVGYCPIISVWDTTSIGTTLITTTSIDTTLTSISTASISTTSSISLQDNKSDASDVIKIAVIIFLCFLIIAMVVKILRLRLRKKKKESEIYLKNSVKVPKEDDMMQKNNNALPEKQPGELHNDENDEEMQIPGAVEELQKEEYSNEELQKEGFVAIGLKEWSHVEVADWVKTVNNGMFAEYVQSFIDNEIDGNILYDITPQQLQLGLYMNNMAKLVEFYNLIQTLKHDKNIDEYAMNNNVEKVIQPISELQRAAHVKRVNGEQDDDNDNDDDDSDSEELYEVCGEIQAPGNIDALNNNDDDNDDDNNNDDHEGH